MTDSNQNMLPCGFFRRIAALLIDMLLLSVAFTLLTVALQPLFETRLKSPSFFTARSCSISDDIPDHFREIANNLKTHEDETLGTVLCHLKSNFVQNFHSLTILSQRQSEGITYKKGFSMWVDQEKRPVEVFDLGWIYLLALPASLAFFLGRFGTTPGKRLLSMQVRDFSNQILALPTAFKREYLKFLPVLVLALPQFLYEAINPIKIENIGATLDGVLANPFLTFAIGGAIFLWLLMLYLWTFIRKVRRPFYDRLAQTIVVRTDRYE